MDLAETHQWADAAQLAGWEESTVYFPMVDSVSNTIDRAQLELAHLHPSRVWIRVRSGFEKRSGRGAAAAGYEWERYSPVLADERTLSLHASRPGKQVSLSSQDIASQETATGMHRKADRHGLIVVQVQGKSLMLLDKCADISLTVNDTRPDMLDELQRRLVKSRITITEDHAG